MGVTEERKARLAGLAEESRRKVAAMSPAVEVARAEWRDVGGDAPGSRLKAVQSVLGASVVVEAIEVGIDDQECQKSVHGAWQDRFLRLHALAGGEGHLDTVKIGGRDYVLFVYPMSG